MMSRKALIVSSICAIFVAALGYFGVLQWRSALPQELTGSYLGNYIDPKSDLMTPTKTTTYPAQLIFVDSHTAEIKLPEDTKTATYIYDQKTGKGELTLDGIECSFEVLGRDSLQFRLGMHKLVYNRLK